MRLEALKVRLEARFEEFKAGKKNDVSKMSDTSSDDGQFLSWH